MAISVKGRKSTNGSGKKVVAGGAAESAAVGNVTFGGECGIAEFERHPALTYRENFHAQHLEALQDSISSNGLLNPISVLEADSKKYIVAGERRLKAISAIESQSPQIYKKTFPNGVPYRIVAHEIGTAKLLQAAENLSREDITAYEVARTIFSLSEDGHSTSDISQAIGKSPTYVRDHIRFMREAGDDLKESLQDEDISFDDALKFMKLTEEEQAEKISKLKEVAANAETKKAKAEAKKEIVTEVKRERGSLERATKADLVKVRDALKEEAFLNSDPEAVYSRGALYFATCAACEFALGVIDIDEFQDTIDHISTKYSKAYAAYSENAAG